MRKILTFAAAILACAALANASLIPTLSTKTPNGSNFAFTYSDAGTTAQLSSSVAVPQATSGVPEPQSWILMAVGFALAAAGMCRRART